MLKFSLLVYQQAAASTASTLPCSVMSLFQNDVQIGFHFKAKQDNLSTM